MYIYIYIHIKCVGWSFLTQDHSDAPLTFNMATWHFIGNGTVLLRNVILHSFLLGVDQGFAEMCLSFLLDPCSKQMLQA